MEKPKEVQTSVFLLTLSLVIGVIRSLLNFFTHPESRPAELSPSGNLLGILSVASVGFIIIYQISKRKNWARILFSFIAVATCASLPFTLRMMNEAGTVSPVSLSLSLAQVFIQVAGIGLLYRPASRRWFRD